MSEQAFSVKLDRVDNYRFVVDFGSPELQAVTVDEMPPLGEGSGPNPTRLLGTAIGSCLAASLLFCLGKARINVGEMSAHVTGSLQRNDKGRLRVEKLQVVLSPEMLAPDVARMGRCLEVFEDFCIVTQSVRDGVNVSVTVEPVVIEPAVAATLAAAG